ncbi:MAG: iron complex outermembrane receptor protein [Paraglaciecola sp.]|jgi:iron complex outermembrane receptor protein
MFKNTKLTKSIRLAIAFSVASTAIITSNAVFAQETEESAVEVAEKIQVTGSRIAKFALSAPAPIISITAEEIARFGTPDLGSILSEIPAISAGSTLIGNNNSNSNAGLSAPDLRNLGENRTLTLVNGIRHVAGQPGTSAVDTGAIPSALIDRVEVITGGASAIYGSDAVSGVINIILKDDFEGFEFNASMADSTEGVGAQSDTFSVLVGANSSDEKGNVTFFVEKSNIREVLTPDLQQNKFYGTVVNPGSTGEEDGIPDKFRVPFVGSEMINDFGVLNPFGGGSRITFTPAGLGVDQVTRDLTNSFAFGNFAQAYDSIFFGERYENYTPAQETITLASTFRYDFNDNIRLYGDIKYVDKDIRQQFQPAFSFGGLDINATDNAFLDETTRQRLFDEGQTGNIAFSRFFGDVGNRSASNDRELFRVVTGAEGFFELGDTVFNYDVFFTHGETKNTRLTLNDIILGNMDAALDSVIDPETGEAACRSQVASAQPEGYEDPADVNESGCVAFNPFGFGNFSDEAVNFVSGDVTRVDEITQDVFGGSLSFDTSQFLTLPGGPIGIAVGFEYREETSSTITDEFTKAGFFTSAATPDSYGEFDVNEAFIEMSLPILKDMAFAKELTLDLAFRAAEYSHAGSADAWQVGFVWAPIEDLRIRGTISEAVRAPNVSEAFDPLSPSFANINDPCDSDNINEDGDRAANCAALGIPVGFEANDNVSIDTLSGGNPDLFSETAESETFGIVWTPSYVENLSLTVDYFNIEISDAINLVEAQDILDNCVDATGGPDSAFCDSIDRNATTNDVELVRSGYINASGFNTKGIEANLKYNTDLSEYDLPGELRFNLSATKLLALEIFEFQNRPDEINIEEGEVGDPELQWSTSVDYRLEDININWSTRYISSVVLYDVSPDGGSPEDVDISKIDAIWTHDLSAVYYLNDNVSFSGGIRNVFNELAPGYTFNPNYDLIGRRFNAGVKVKF